LASDLRPKCSYHFLWCPNGFNCRIVSKSCQRCLVRIVGLKQGKTLKQKEEATRTHHLSVWKKFETVKPASLEVGDESLTAGESKDRCNNNTDVAFLWTRKPKINFRASKIRNWYWHLIAITIRVLLIKTHSKSNVHNTAWSNSKLF
jgi:hypothetical protein